MIYDTCQTEVCQSLVFGFLICFIKTLHGVGHGELLIFNFFKL